MKTILRIVAGASVALALSASAQDEALDAEDESAEIDVADATSGEDESAASGDDADKAPMGAAKKNERIFTSLPLCIELQGRAEVRRPGAKAWAPMEEAKFYPLGSSFRTTDADSSLRIQFGAEAEVCIDRSIASFSTRLEPLGGKERAITLDSGIITLKLRRDFPAGLFTVSTPGFTVVDPQGSSRYAYTKTVDGEVAQIRCLTGGLTIKGRHFTFPRLKVKDEVKIRSSQDQLFTGLYGKSGDCLVKLDQGLVRTPDYSTTDEETGKPAFKDVAKSLDWKLSPKTAVRIHRALPAIGERMSVTIMTFDVRGGLKNRFAFAEGRAEVNSGELCVAAQSQDEASAKQTAEAAETTAMEIDMDDDDTDSGVADETGSEEPAGSGDAGGGEDLDF